jgi:hypothetical protein
MNEFSIDPDRHPRDGVSLPVEEGTVLHLVKTTGERQALRIAEVYGDSIAGQDGGHSFRVRAGTTADGRWFLCLEAEAGDEFATFATLAELGSYVWNDLVFEDHTCAPVLLALGLLDFNPLGQPADRSAPAGAPTGSRRRWRGADGPR